MSSPTRFRFLNREDEVRTAADWDKAGREALWTYNLHYFDDLNARNADERSEWHRSLLARWIAENPIGHGRGWDPFPTSLRLVNWIKWLWRGNAPLDGMIQSMAVQARWLERRIEYHLLGNHVLVDAKGLLFAGFAFGGAEGERWLRKGCRLLCDQLAEQFLPDGGHFELSPMYHSLMIEDLLDVINAGRGRLSEPVLEQLAGYAARGLGWLDTLADEQGRVPLLNDATGDVSATLSELRDYAAQMGIRPNTSNLRSVQFAHGWTGRCCSGYWVLTNGPFRLWFDAAPLGPDYQPGHAHGDMLSLLLNYSGEPVLTDTGISTYEPGKQRDYERSVAAHNTVRIDELDQAEFWSGFRVARRGHPLGFRLLPDGLQCGHDGFAVQRRGLFHTRRVELKPEGFVVTDSLNGSATHSFEAFWHFAPNVSVEIMKPGKIVVARKLTVEVDGGSPRLEESCYCGRHGLVEARKCLVVSGTFSGNAKLRLSCSVRP